MERVGTTVDTNVGKAALVLEGGGMRGVYTTGVLDWLLDAGLLFDYVIGTSAGASHALSYISRQRGRARRVNVDYCRRNDYFGPLCLLREGSLFGMDLLFNKIPYRYDPYDFESFEQNVREYYAVVTDIETADAVYLAPRTASALLPAIRASCSLPLVSRPVTIGGHSYLDGGIADSIPVRKPLSDGCVRLVVVLTQPKGYRKATAKKRGIAKALENWLYRSVYRNYPAFAASLEKRNRAYNETLDLVDRLEEEGTALVIRPKLQPGLSRFERHPDILDGLYRSGYADAAALEAGLREVLH